jgi:acetyl esterase/lipase
MSSYSEEPVMRAIFSFVVALSLVPLAFGQQPQAKAPLPENIKVQTDVEYAKAGDVSLKLDLYQPKSDITKARPCVVWIHGGGWQGGNKSSGARLVAPLVASGDYVGVSVGYRLTDVATWPAQICDCKAAIRYLRANAAKLGIDPNKIGVWGGSAGGHLVALLGTSGDVKELEGDLGTTGVSSRVSCVIDFFGPTDFLAFGVTNPRLNEPGQPVYKLFGGPLKDKQAEAKQASPVTYISKDDAPFLIMHGTKDPTVNISQSERLYDLQKQAGASTLLVKVIDGGHGFAGPEISSRVKSFFDKHLLGKEVAVSEEPIQAPPAPAK